MKILVTGGSGFLGRAIIQQLNAQQHEAVAFCRGHYPDLVSTGIKVIQGDIQDKNALLGAAQGVEAVIHTAAKAGIWGDYQEYFDTNVTGTQNVIETCKKLNIKYLVYTSTPSVVFDGKDICGGDESLAYAKNFLTAYPATKKIAEEMVLEAGNNDLYTVALRPHLIWGPGDHHLIPRLIARARLGKVKLIKRDCIVDTVYVDNAAFAHILALQKLQSNKAIAGKVYFISQDQPIDLNAFINQILAMANLPLVTPSVSPKAAYIVGATLETLYKILHIKKEPLMTRFLAKQLSTSHWFNIAAAKQDLGYYPLINMEEGLEKLKHFFQMQANYE